ncbi:uncharacterized protein [Centruroides vittatus]|uniref:uncharacterized protein n=1 Tax=Centruroides vittatus TaxID=120091 RepID=UPI00350EC988
MQYFGFYDDLPILIAFRNIFDSSINDILLIAFYYGFFIASITFIFNFTSLPTKSEKETNRVWMQTYNKITNSYSQKLERFIVKVQYILCKILLLIIMLLISSFFLKISFKLLLSLVNYFEKFEAFLYSTVIFLYCFYASLITVSIEMYIGVVCLAMKKKFDEVYHHFDYLLRNMNEINSLKSIQNRHYNVCLMMGAVDILFRYILFQLYVLFIPLLFLCLKGLFHHKKVAAKVIIYIIANISFLSIISITLFAGWASVTVYKIRNALIELADREIPSRERIQVSIYLNRLKGPVIGLSCMGIFTVTPYTLTAVFSLLLTYLLMYYQFEQQKNYSSDSREN